MDAEIATYRVHVRVELFPDIDPCFDKTIPVDQPVCVKRRRSRWRNIRGAGSKAEAVRLPHVPAFTCA